MTKIVCDGRDVPIEEGETVLEALLRAGLRVAHSCRAGACQSCLVRATAGTPPAAAQIGLKETLKAQGYFLACAARTPAAPLTVSLTATEGITVPARIAAVNRLAADVLQVIVEPAAPFTYRAGQFVTLMRKDNTARSYSLASLPADGAPLELHVRQLPAGRMSGWLASPEAPGSEVRLRGPAGSCFYTEEAPEQPLLLAGTGCGLAPLYGIVRDALQRGHRGPIHLLHGARNPAGFYLVEALQALAREHPSFDYLRCSLEGPATPGVELGALDQVLRARHPDLTGRRVFLCGGPDLVNRLRRQAFLAGARLPEIHADPFLTAAPPPTA